MDQWHYRDGETAVGPFTTDRIHELKAAGLISGETLLRSRPDEAWRPAADILAQGRSGAPAEARPASPTDWSADPVAPWRRFAARVLDTTINGGIGFALLAIAAYAIAPASAEAAFLMFEGSAGRLADFVLTTLLASLIGGVLIGTTGSTLGKFVFGVKVIRPDGRRPGLLAGLARDLSVFMRGLGFGIPIVAFVTQIVAYQTLRAQGECPWDKGRYVVLHRPNGPVQFLLNALGLIMIVLIVIGARALASL